MALSIISNFAANVAHRNLVTSNAKADSSIAKLSSGNRVLGAKDDAASLAIGSRLRAEVAAMTQASTNASQAVSMLQIADGAMSQINDVLVRLKSLAVQSGSDQLGATERGLLDTEFQQLLLEIDRISDDTEFNGLSLLDGTKGGTSAFASNSGTNLATSLTASNGITAVTFDAAAAIGTFSIANDGTNMIVTNLTDNTSQSVALPVTPAAGATADIKFSNYGLTVTIDDKFDSSATQLLVDGSFIGSLVTTSQLSKDNGFEKVFVQSGVSKATTSVIANGDGSVTATNLASGLTQTISSITAPAAGTTSRLNFDKIGVVIEINDKFSATYNSSLIESESLNLTGASSVIGSNGLVSLEATAGVKGNVSLDFNSATSEFTLKDLDTGTSATAILASTPDSGKFAYLKFTVGTTDYQLTIDSNFSASAVQTAINVAKTLTSSALADGGHLTSIRFLGAEANGGGDQTLDVTFFSAGYSLTVSGPATSADLHLMSASTVAGHTFSNTAIDLTSANSQVVTLTNGSGDKLYFQIDDDFISGTIASSTIDLTSVFSAADADGLDASAITSGAGDLGTIILSSMSILSATATTLSTAAAVTLNVSGADTTLAQINLVFTDSNGVVTRQFANLDVDFNAATTMVLTDISTAETITIDVTNNDLGNVAFTNVGAVDVTTMFGTNTTASVTGTTGAGLGAFTDITLKGMKGDFTALEAADAVLSFSGDATSNIMKLTIGTKIYTSAAIDINTGTTRDVVLKDGTDEVTLTLNNTGTLSGSVIGTLVSDTLFDNVGLFSGRANNQGVLTSGVVTNDVGRIDTIKIERVRGDISGLTTDTDLDFVFAGSATNVILQLGGNFTSSNINLDVLATGSQLITLDDGAGNEIDISFNIKTAFVTADDEDLKFDFSDYFEDVVSKDGSTKDVKALSDAAVSGGTGAIGNITVEKITGSVDTVDSSSVVITGLDTPSSTTFTIKSTDGKDFVATGVNMSATTTNTNVVLKDGQGNEITIQFDVTADFNDAASTSATIDLGTYLKNVSSSTGAASVIGDKNFTFKIGTGNETFDRITLNLEAVGLQALGLKGLDVKTSAKADAASLAVTNALTTLSGARSTTGAFQNRLEIAGLNLATSRENTEAARSSLLDLDIAQEMTNFTSQQLLVQAGVSMLAQANQLPQNLLRLLQ